MSQSLFFACSRIQVSTSPSDFPAFKRFEMSSAANPVKVRKRSSRGQAKWYSPALPASSPRPLSSILGKMTYPPSFNRGLLGGRWVRSVIFMVQSEVGRREVNWALGLTSSGLTNSRLRNQEPEKRALVRMSCLG